MDSGGGVAQADCKFSSLVHSKPPCPRLLIGQDSDWALALQLILLEKLRTIEARWSPD